MWQEGHEMRERIKTALTVILASLILVTTGCVNRSEAQSALGQGVYNAEQEYSNGTLRYNTAAVLDLGHERTYGATIRFNWTMFYEGYTW